MKVLLTGASGRIGSHVCKRLVEAGMDVRATDQVANRELPVRVDIVNLLDREACYRLIEGVEAIVHLANHPGPHGRNAQRIFNENVSMNMNVFQAAAELGVKKVVFSSSIQAMTGRRYYRGEGEMPPSELAYLPVDGDHPANPGNTYGLSKQASEEMLRYYAKNHSMDCVALRFPLVTEKRWFERMREHWRQDPRPHGSLDEAFSYILIEDAAELVRAILVSPLPGFRIYLPVGASTTVEMPVRELIERFYASVPLRRPVDELTSLVDVSRIRQETGWSPQG